MAGEDDELARMLDAWRNDIDSVPFPAFDVGILPVTLPHRPARRRGWRELSRLHRVMRVRKKAKAR